MRRVKMLFGYVLTSKTALSSYYPNKPHKSKCKIFIENCLHILKYGEINDFYYIYGLDVKGGTFNSKDLMSYGEFMDIRNRANYTKPYSYVCLLRDKELFSMVAGYYGYKCASNIGRYDYKTKLVVYPNRETIDLVSLVREVGNLFLKPFDAECGEGIFQLTYNNQEFLINDEVVTEDEVIKHIDNIHQTYLVQRRIVQHPEMNKIYPLSVNTLRITTITNRHTNEVELFGSLLRVGARGNVVDNWAKGGLVMSVNDDGTLSTYGFFKPGYGERTTQHPDTQIKFSEFNVPFYKEAVEMCLSFHKDLEYIPAIGWDVAITPEGPMFIEGNDNWEISMYQIFGGKKTHFVSLLK